MKFVNVGSSSENGCLSATFLKFIALLCMTADHLGAYSFEIPIKDNLKKAPCSDTVKKRTPTAELEELLREFLA